MSSEVRVRRPNKHVWRNAGLAAVPTYVGLLILFVPGHSRGGAYAAGEVLTPAVLAAVIVGVMAWESPRAWRWWTYIAGVPSVAAVIVGIVVLGRLVTADDKEMQGGVVTSDSLRSLSGDDIVAVPLSEPTRPSEFAGDDDGFLRRVHDYLDEAEVTTQVPPDVVLVTVGREFCSVLSGGGMLADKVDFWAGTRHLENGPDVPIIDAAFDVYCPDLSDGYLRIRLGSQSEEPTVRQHADFARFAATLHQPGGVPRIQRMSSADLERAGSILCETSFDPGWVRSRPIAHLIRSIPPTAGGQYVLGLAVAFCPDVADDPGFAAFFGQRVI